METKKLPIGISDFKDLVTGNYTYVDKTLFIKEIIDKGDKILLVPRPRRFGKTLNLSMLKYFYDCCPQIPFGSDASLADKFGRDIDADEDANKESPPPHPNRKLFDSLAIGKAGGQYMEHMGKYPVIFLTFKDIKETELEVTYRKISKLIRREYLKHDYLVKSPGLKSQERDYFKRIIDLKGNKEDYESSLENLLIFLNRHYGQRVVILIDEYDAPVHGGFNYGYYDEIVNFMRNFLSGGLKDTDQYLEKGVLTGIMRIAKESIFSGLNNLGVYTLLAEEFDDKFGFTEEEVEALLREYRLFDRCEEVREWYNGYRFGKRVIYNPWSIINFLGSKDKKLKPYWINTSHNEIVETLLSKGGKELKEELEQLIRGECIEKAVDENIVLKNIDRDDDSLWSFLLMGGYLKPTSERMDPITNKTYYTLVVPNREVSITYTGIVTRYFSTKIENKQLQTMLKALLEGDIDIFEEIFSAYVTTAMSFFDTAGDPEKVYHAFVMGLLLWLAPDYQVKSNRESGYGRYDITIIPTDPKKLGYVIEFKKVRPKETTESAIEAALKQIEEKKYETELVERGITTYKKLAIAFNGKVVTVREG